MLTQTLDRETERYLSDILTQQNTTSDELIRQLIRERWLSLQHSRELVEPKSVVATPTDTPRPKNQKQLIAEFVKKKVQRAL
jgi:hypothetical protein